MKQLIIVAIALLVGCGASLEDEFARQITEQIKDEHRCIEIGSATSPEGPYRTTLLGDKSAGAFERRLAEAGFGTIEVVDGYKQLLTLNDWVLPLLEHGKPRKDRWGEVYNSYELCYARPVFKGIVNYTEPADFLGNVVVNVRYAIGMEGFPEWATPELHSQIKRDFAQAAEPYLGSVVFVKTNEGWELGESVKIKKPWPF